MRRAAAVLALVLVTSGCGLLPDRPDWWQRKYHEDVKGVSIEEAGWENGGYDREAWRARMHVEFYGR